jgi:Xaa-Pro aminopeptidase
MIDKDIDGVFISQPDNRYYLSGFNGSDGYLLITQQDTILATDFRYIEQAGSQSPDYRIYRISGKIADWFPSLVTELKLKRLGFESEHITFRMYHQLSDALKKDPSHPNLVPVEGLVESLRSIKEPEEIEFITRAAEIADKAIIYIEEVIDIGMTEKEVAWHIERFMRENGSQSIPFEAIVASGPNSALPHHQPSQRKINSGEPIVIDIGARVEGYCSDLTRTICLGTPDETFRKIYDTVLGAQLTAIAIIKEGMSGKEADSLARIAIEEAGYGEAFGHSLGHGVGLAPHEQPGLGPNSTDSLNNGMVFSIEPGIYITGWGGVRIEDLCMMEESKVKLLTKARKN